jgi:hypothetical protein
MDRAKLERFPKQPLWDSLTAQTINKLRAFLHRVPQPTISYIQEQSLKARPLKGPFSVFQTTIPAPPQDDVRQLLLQTIRDMGEAQFPAPALEDVHVEWVVKHSSAGGWGECEGLETVFRQAATDMTVLHVHGGAYLYMSLPLTSSYSTQLTRRHGIAKAAPLFTDPPHRSSPPSLVAAWYQSNTDSRRSTLSPPASSTS